MVESTHDPVNAIELAAIAAHASERIARVELGSRTVWVKRASAKALPISHYLQWAASAVLPGSVFRPAPPERGDEASRNEAARIKGFADKGFPVPAVLFQGKGVLILEDCGETLERRLKTLQKTGDVEAHEELLVRMATSMGQVHQAKLVHGRPHPRDMFLRDDVVGYMDFEQNPLGAMSLERAQVRDLLCLFGYICDLALKPDTPRIAYEAWANSAPEAAKKQLAPTVSSMSPLVTLASAAGRIKLGSDLRRFIAGTSFLLNIVRAPFAARKPANS
jgi:hypothetical protein